MPQDKNINDWEDIPVSESQNPPKIDDWQDVPPGGEFGEISPLQSAISGFSKGFTVDYGDEISGRARAAVTAPFVDETYDQLKDKYVGEQRRYADAAAKANPVVNTGAQLYGTYASPVSKILAPVKGAKMLWNLGKVALEGGLIAGGASESSLEDDPENLAKDVAIGSVAAPVAQGVLGGISKTAKALAPESLKKFARDRWLKSAIGQNERVWNKLSGEAEEQKIANHLTQGVPEIGIPPLTSFGQKASELLPNVDSARKQAWKARSGVHRVVDKITGGRSTTGHEVARALIDEARRIPLGQRSNKAMRDSLVEEAKYIRRQHGEISLKKAQELKNSVKYKEADPKMAVLGMDGTNAIKRAYEKAISSSVARNSGENAVKHAAASSAYGSFATLAPATKKAMNKARSNRFFSPTDHGAGGIGALGLGALGALAAPEDHRAEGALKSAALGSSLGFANKILRQRGSSMAASGAQKLMEVIENNPRTLGAFQQWASKLNQTPTAAAIVQWYNRNVGGTEE